MNYTTLQEIIDSKDVEYWNNNLRKFEDFFDWPGQNEEIKLNSEFFEWSVSTLLPKIYDNITIFKGFNVEAFVLNLTKFNYTPNEKEYRMLLVELNNIKDEERNFKLIVKALLSNYKKPWYYTRQLILFATQFKEYIDRPDYLVRVFNKSFFNIENLHNFQDGGWKAILKIYKLNISLMETQYAHYIDGKVLIAVYTEQEILDLALYGNWARIITAAASKELLFKIFDNTTDNPDADNYAVGIYGWAEKNPEGHITLEEIKKYSKYIQLTDGIVNRLVDKQVLIDIGAHPDYLVMHPDFSISELAGMCTTTEQELELGVKMIEARFVSEEEILANIDLFDPSKLKQRFWISKEGWKKLNSYHHRKQYYNPDVRENFDYIWVTEASKLMFTKENLIYLIERMKPSEDFAIRSILNYDSEYIENKEIKKVKAVLESLYK